MLRSTTPARLALCRFVRDWPMNSLSRRWLQWCDTRDFQPLAPWERSAGRVNLREAFDRSPVR